MVWQKNSHCVKSMGDLSAQENKLSGFKGKIILNEPLRKHTTFKIGGPAKYFIVPFDLPELICALDFASLNKIPFLVIGAGSNLLVSDKGIDGVVVKLSSDSFKKILFKDTVLEVGSGCLLSTLINEAVQNGLSFLEFLTGIPGTVGGALVMNAGIPGKSISDLIEDVTVMDYNGKVKVLRRADIEFGYRQSSLSDCIVLSANLKCVRRDAIEIKSRIKAYLDARKNSQELNLPSAGCVFKNSSIGPAGRLIDSCGLKGKMIGSARVSEKHANFIVNTGYAKAEDVFTLMKLIIKDVENKFNVTLEPEIKIWE